MQRATLTIKSVEDFLSTGFEKASDRRTVKDAEALPLRRDMVTLLAFVRDNRGCRSIRLPTG